MANLVNLELTATQKAQATHELNTGLGSELTFEQFVKWWRGSTEIAVLLRRGFVAEEANITASFEHIDKDGNGSLDIEELKELAEVMGIVLTASELNDMVNSLRAEHEPVQLDAFIEWWLEGGVVADRMRMASRKGGERLKLIWDRLPEGIADGSGYSGTLTETNFNVTLRALLTIGGPDDPERVSEAEGEACLKEMRHGQFTVNKKTAARDSGVKDKALEPGMRLNVEPHGEGVYERFEKNTIGANAHFLRFDSADSAGVVQEVSLHRFRGGGEVNLDPGEWSVAADQGIDFETLSVWWQSDGKWAKHVRLAHLNDESNVRMIWGQLLDMCKKQEVGRLDHDDIETLFEELGLEGGSSLGLLPEEITAALSEIDIHGDGQVEFNEFFVWMTGNSSKVSHFAQQIRRKVEERGAEPFPYIRAGKLSDKLNVIVKSSQFDVFIIIMVVVNTAFMALEHHGSPEWVSATVRFSEHFFAFLYLLEALMKIFGLGLGPYFKVKQNQVDIGIVYLSFVGFFWQSASSASSFRVVRLIVKMLRMVRLAEVFAHNDAMVMLIKTVTSSADLLEGLLLFIFAVMCVLSVAAGQILGKCHSTKTVGSFSGIINQLSGQEYNTTGFPRENFYFFSDALLANFQIMSGEDWAPMMYRYASCSGPWAIAYFVVVVILTNFFLLNIFIAVILENFDISEEDKLIKQESKYVAKNGSKPFIEFSHWQVEGSRHILAKQFGKEFADAVEGDNAPSARNVAKVIKQGLREDEKAVDMGDMVPVPETVVKSLCCLGVANPLRVACKSITENHVFETAIFISIMTSAVAIAFQGPPNGDGCSGCGDETVADLLQLVDVIVYFIFLVEMIIKITAMGFSSAVNAYWTNGWNRLDFGIVMVSTVDIVLRYAELAVSPGEKVLKTLRVLRVLRPLRMLQFNEGIRVVFSALLECAPTAFAVVLLSFLCYIAFAILGVGLFSGQFYRCDCGGEWGKPELNCTVTEGVETLDRGPCLEQGGAWENPPYNFDNFFSAIRTLFICSTTEGWIDVMHSGMDVTGVIDGDYYTAPVQDASYVYAIFFVTYILICTFFVTNIFIGVLVNFFGQEDGSLLRTDSQQSWEETKEMVTETHPRMDIELQKHGCLGPLRERLYPIALSKWFKHLMNGLITINVVVLILEHVPLSYEKQSVLDHLNFALLLAFTLEMIIKMVAYGPDPSYPMIPHYMASSWNRIDLFTVMVSWIGELSTIGGMQALRGIRVIRFAEEVKTLQSLLGTLIKSMAPAGNIFCLLCLVYFTFGVVGMALFGGVTRGQFLTNEDNFDDIFHAMRVMFQISTGQDFMNLMHELELAGCQFVFAFFGSYVVMSVWIFFNFFVAVVLQNFDRNFVASQMEISSWHIKKFKRQWQKLTEAPDHKTLRVDQIPLLVSRLPAPLSHVMKDGPTWFNRLLFELKVDLMLTPHAEAPFHDVLLMLCLVSHSGYAGLSYEEQQKKRAAIRSRVMTHAGRVMVICVRIWLMSRRPPPKEFIETLKRRDLAGKATSKADLQRKWAVALQGIRLMRLDSVVRVNKLGKSAEKPDNPLKATMQMALAMTTLQRRKLQSDWDKTEAAEKLADNSAKAAAALSSRDLLRPKTPNGTPISNPMFFHLTDGQQTTQDSIEELKGLLNQMDDPEDRSKLNQRIRNLKEKLPEDHALSEEALAPFRTSANAGRVQQ